MDKYGVQTEPDDNDGKTAAENYKCPKCGQELVPTAGVRLCPNCGTEPFEPSPEK